jgi:hypothetical protein
LGHLNAVLFARKFIQDVVSGGAIFVKHLVAAVLNMAHFRRWRTFDLVAQQGPANQAQHGGCVATKALSHTVADGATGDGAHGRTRTGFLARGDHLILGAHLTRHRHLLDDGC